MLPWFSFPLWSYAVLPEDSFSGQYPISTSVFIGHLVR
jgi:hypothetical protein